MALIVPLLVVGCVLILTVLNSCVFDVQSQKTTADAALNIEGDAYIAAVASQYDEEILDSIYNQLSNLDGENAAEIEILFSSLMKPSVFAFEYFKKFDIPFLHHILNAYFISRDPTVQQTLVNFLLQNLDDVNLAADLPYRRDPHVIQKLLLVREVMLASKVAQYSSIFNVPSPSSGKKHLSKDVFESLVQIYSLVCEPVPLTKLYLAGDSFVRSRPRRQESFQGGVEGVKQLLASANPGNSKPSIKMFELLKVNSTSNLKIIENLGYDSGNVIRMDDILHALVDLSNHFHSNIVNLWEQSLANYTQGSDSSSTGGYDALALLFSEEDAKSRNLFHYLFQGSVKIIDDLHGFFSKLTQVFPSTKSTFKMALLSVDYRRMKPLEYTIVRFGVDSVYVEAALRVYRLFFSQSEIDTLILNSPKTQTPAHSSSSGGGNSDNLLNERKEKEIEVEDSISDNNSSDDQTGGWNSDYFKLSYIDPSLNDKLNDRNHCDIIEVDGQPPNSAEFFEKYIRTGTPVIFRNAMPLNHTLRSAFTKSKFIRKYGKETVPVSSIPYAATFGFKSTAKSLHEVADMSSFEIYSDINRKLASGATIADDELPRYAFSVANPKWSDKLKLDATIPELIADRMFSESQPINGDNVEIQFYLGPGGSGAPVHFHGHAVNSLAFGEKKWMLFPPARAFYSTLPALPFFSSHPQVKSAMICTQKAGDIMYVPSLWGHSTLNMKQAIGVAHEFSIETFCME